MKRSVWVPLLIAMLWQVLSPQGVSPATAGAPVQSLQTAADGLRVTWNLPAYEMQQEGANLRLTVAGLPQTTQAGQYDLPEGYLLIALPADAQPELVVLRVVEQTLFLPQSPARLPARQAAADAVPLPPPDLPAPLARVDLQELGVMRGVRLARLTFHPLRPQGQSWAWTSQLTVELSYGGATAARPAAQDRSVPDPALDLIRARVANPDQVDVAPPVTLIPAAADPAANLLLQVSQPGLIQITPETLRQGGLNVDAINPRNLSLWHGTDEIALDWQGDQDDAFTSGERLLFYAEPTFSRYDAADTWALRIGTVPGKRVLSRPAPVEDAPPGMRWRTLIVEQNRHYTPDCLCGLTPRGHDGDRWAWDAFSSLDAASHSYPFDLPTAADAPAALTVWMIGSTDLPAIAVDHALRATLNGTDLGVQTWQGKQLGALTFDVPAAALLDGENVLTLSLPGLPGVSLEGAWLDAFSLRYATLTSADPADSAMIFEGSSTPRSYPVAAGALAYDISDPTAPVRLLPSASGRISDDANGTLPARYVIAAAAQDAPVARAPIPLRAAADSAADLLLIAHPNLLPAAETLAEFHRSQGMRVAVEDVRAIYDAYSHGRVDPQAIQDFIADRYHHASPRPSAVLLFGDGTSDPRRYLAVSAATLIPPFLAPVDPWAGETAADNRFVTVDGADVLPDLAIGRIPANTLAQAQAIVAKTIANERVPSASEDEPRAAPLVTLADNADHSGDFAAIARYIAEPLALMPGVLRRFSYLVPAPLDEMRRAARASFGMGGGVVVYAGHSSIHQWAEESFLHITQVAALPAARRVPLVLEMTCLTASFQVPGFDVLDEALLRQPHGGALAVWGSTGLGLADGHALLARNVVDALYADPQLPVGQAALAAKLSLAAAQPSLIDLVETYTLLGDPSAPAPVIDQPGDYVVLLPLIQSAP